MITTAGWPSAPATPLAHDALVGALAAQGFDDRTVAAVASVPRDAFVPRTLWRLGHADVDLWRFGLGPSARTAAALVEAAAVRPDECCVELGTGNGWAAAVLARQAARVSTVSRLPGEWAAPTLQECAVNVLGCADLAGPAGPAVMAEADVVVVTYAPGEVPVRVLHALRTGARLVVAAGAGPQPVTVLTVRDGAVEVEHRGEVRLGVRADLDDALAAALSWTGSATIGGRP